MKTYVLTVSTTFPKSHPRAGEQTGFVEGINECLKIHTIRKNYDLWANRFDAINAGAAVLSLRIWAGKPYRSKQLEFMRLDKSHGIGIQKLEQPNNFAFALIDSAKINWDLVAQNDGLSLDDFGDWFKVVPVAPMVVIHFTPFRYTPFQYKPFQYK